jgi:hypothetical protein
MTATPPTNMKDVFDFSDVPEDRAPALRIGLMKRIKRELPELSEATDDAQVLAHALRRLSGAVDPTVENGDDCLERLRRGGIRLILNDLTAHLEALGV